MKVNKKENEDTIIRGLMHILRDKFNAEDEASRKKYTQYSIREQINLLAVEKMRIQAHHNKLIGEMNARIETLKEELVASI